MPVLAEAISVIIKDSAIRSKFVGGIDAFYDTIPNSTYCCDGKIHRLGFMTPDDNKQYVQLLERNGLTFIIDGQFIDIAVVDMLRGTTIECPWIGFARKQFFKGQTQWKKSEEFFSIVWLHDGMHGYGIPANQNFEVDIAFPDVWTPDRAIYGDRFVLTEKVDESLIEICTKDGVTKYLHTDIEEIVHVGRPKIEGKDNTDKN